MEQLLCDGIPECKVDKGYHRGCGSGGVGSVSKLYMCTAWVLASCRCAQRVVDVHSVGVL